MRAAQHIASKAHSEKDANPIPIPKEELQNFINKITFHDKKGVKTNAKTSAKTSDNAMNEEAVKESILEKQVFLQKEMSCKAAHIRDLAAIRELEPALKKELEILLRRVLMPQELPGYFKYKDMLLTQLALLSAILIAGENFGSRGSSFIITEDGEEVSDKLSGYRYAPKKQNSAKQKTETNYAVLTQKKKDSLISGLCPVRPVPDRDTWFETVWNAFSSRNLR